MPEMIALPLRQMRRGIFPAFMILLLISLALYALALEVFGVGDAQQRVTHTARNLLRS